MYAYSLYTYSGHLTCGQLPSIYFKRRSPSPRRRTTRDTKLALANQLTFMPHASFWADRTTALTESDTAQECRANFCQLLAIAGSNSCFTECSSGVNTASVTALAKPSCSWLCWTASTSPSALPHATVWGCTSGTCNGSKRACEVTRRTGMLSARLISPTPSNASCTRLSSCRPPRPAQPSPIGWASRARTCRSLASGPHPPW